MKVKKNDFVVCEQDGVVFTARVLAQSSSTLKVVELKDEHIPSKRNVIELKTSELKINFGDEPPAGKAYGTDFGSVFSGRKENDHFGTLNFFYRPSKEVTKNLNLGYSRVFKILKKRGLEKVSSDPIVWEIEPYRKEKYAGMYRPAKSENDSPRIAFKPESVPSSSYPYVILHELGHHLHYAYLKQNPELEAKWIKLFNTSIKVVNIPKELSREVLSILLKGDVAPSKLKSELDDDDLKLAYGWILRTIQQNHAISVGELGTLLTAGQEEEITNIWPKHTIKKKDLALVISEYACRSYKETVAEAISFYLVGMKLPKHVVKLTERTLSYIKTQL